MSTPRLGMPSGTSRTVLSRAALAALLAPALALSAVPASAGGQARPDDGSPTGPTTVATGLNNPRQLSFASNGDLYIAESGAPGEPTGPCVTSEEFGEQCLNDSGSITRLKRNGTQSRVLTGLPAIFSESESVGPSDVYLAGNRVVISFGLGGTTERRAQFGPDAARMGTITSISLHAPHQQRLLIDVAAHENSDPDGQGVDSNPVDVETYRGTVYTTDAGGNTVVREGRRGSETAAVLPGSMAEAPPFMGLPPGAMIPVQSVPTATAMGPDRALYVSELNGFPFPVGGSTIWKLSSRGEATAYATGLTNVTDLAWDGADLYAVQLTDTGLLAGDMIGSVVRVDPDGTHEDVSGPLFAPYGIAIRGDHAYVTTCSVCAGGGEVVTIDLDD